MSATLAPSAAPPNALRMWTDGRMIYAELQRLSTVATPAILSFSKTEAGLSKALALLCQHADTSGQPQILPTPKPQSPREAQAEALLRKHGLLR